MNDFNKNRIISCSRCGLDSTIPSIRFDDKGNCNFCLSHDLLINIYPRDENILRNKKIFQPLEFFHHTFYFFQ